MPNKDYDRFGLKKFINKNQIVSYNHLTYVRNNAYYRFILLLLQEQHRSHVKFTNKEKKVLFTEEPTPIYQPRNNKHANTIRKDKSNITVLSM